MTPSDTSAVFERLARLETRQEGFAEDIDEIKSEQAAQSTLLQEIRDAVVAVKGGWKIIAGLLAVVGTIAGIGTAVVQYLKP